MSVVYIVHGLIKENNLLDRWLVKLGTMTMGVYCIQNYFWILYVDYVDWVVRPVFLNQLLAFVASLAVSCLITMALKRIKVLNVLFLGGR